MIRRISSIKPIKEKKVREDYPQVKLMGSKAKGETKQIKLNNVAVNALGLSRGDMIDIIDKGNGAFLIAKTDDGRKLSEIKGQGSLCVTFSEAYKLLKGLSYTFKIDDAVYLPTSNEERDVLGRFSWHSLIPVVESVTPATPTQEVTTQPVQKVEEKVAKDDKEF